MTVLDVEAVLRDHSFSLSTSKCVCGVGPRRGQNWFDHRAHVAAVLRVEIESALGDAFDDGLWAACVDNGIVYDAGRRPANPYRPTLAADEGGGR